MKNTKAGFSLIEVVITALLIAIAAVTALSFIVYCDRLTLQADARITAANFARQTMERFYKRNYEDIRLNETGGTLHPLPASPTFGGGFRDRYPTAAREYTVTENTGYGYKLITTKVKWNQ